MIRCKWWNFYEASLKGSGKKRHWFYAWFSDGSYLLLDWPLKKKKGA